MEHWLYRMKSDEKDPIHSGYMGSWFEYYKKNAGVTHVPVGLDVVKQGDVIWFILDNACVGGAQVIRIDYNVNTGMYDVYYDSDALQGPEHRPDECLFLRG